MGRDAVMVTLAADHIGPVKQAAMRKRAEKTLFFEVRLVLSARQQRGVLHNLLAETAFASHFCTSRQVQGLRMDGGSGHLTRNLETF